MSFSHPGRSLTRPLGKNAIKRLGRSARLDGRVVSNLVGALLDKVMPLLIAIVLTQHMSSRDFGLWSQLLQMALICNAILLSTNAIFFGRDQVSIQGSKLPIYNFPLTLSWLCLLAFSYVLFFPTLNDACPVWLVIPFLLLFSVYSYYSLYLRFRGQDRLYVVAAASRILLFIPLCYFFVHAFGSIKLHWLVLGLVISHFPVGVCAMKVIDIRWKVAKAMLPEYCQLTAYGLLTVLFSGIDRFVTEFSGYTYEQLGVYCYAATFAAVPSFFVEGLKRYLLPDIYKNLNFHGELTRLTKKKIRASACLVVVAQFVGPLAVFKAVEMLGMVPPMYVGGESLISVIGLLSVALCVHNLYHFINPCLLYFKRSFILSVSQIMAVAAYFVVVMTAVTLTDTRLAIAKILMAGVLLCIPLVYLVGGGMKKINDSRGL